MGDQSAAFVIPISSDTIVDRNSMSDSLIHEHKRKQRHGNDDVKQSKVKKCQILSDSIQTHFDVLNIDCLERIFGHLGFVDLLNVADLNESTMKAAEIVFSRRYSNHLIKLCGPGYEAIPSIAIRNSLITISTASLCIKVLQSFGDIVKKLELAHFRDEM